MDLFGKKAQQRVELLEKELFDLQQNNWGLIESCEYFVKAFEEADIDNIKDGINYINQSLDKIKGTEITYEAPVPARH